LLRLLLTGSDTLSLSELGEIYEEFCCCG